MFAFFNLGAAELIVLAVMGLGLLAGLVILIVTMTRGGGEGRD